MDNIVTVLQPKLLAMREGASWYEWAEHPGLGDWNDSDEIPDPIQATYHRTRIMKAGEGLNSFHYAVQDERIADEFLRQDIERRILQAEVRELRDKAMDERNRADRLEKELNRIQFASPLALIRFALTGKTPGDD